jgi:HK97 family phage major capsid protein
VARKYVNPNRQDRPRVLGMESMPPGYERTAEYRAALEDLDYEERKTARSLEILRDAQPAGAALDKYPFAASWSAFLTAIKGDAKDGGTVRRTILNAMSERVPSEGGYLVPWRLTEQVLNYITPAIMRRLAMPVAMDTPRVSLPLLDNPSQASGRQALGGLTFAMVEEGQSFTATKPQFGQVTLEARKIGAYMTNVPNELLADATPFTEDFLPRVIAVGLDWWIDDLCIANGTGVGEPQALLNSPAAAAVTRANSGGAPVHADVVAMLKAAHPASKNNLTWLMSEDVFDALLELYEIVGTAPSGQQIPPPQTLKFNSRTGTWELLGVPAFVNDHQPAAGSTGDLALCDLSQYVLGAVEWLTIEVSSKGSGFMSNASNIRVRSRLDGRFWPQVPWTLANGRQASPLVVLH